MIAPCPLIGERLELRPMAREDISRFVEWTMDPEVMVPVSGGLLFTMEDEIAWFESETRNPATWQYTIVMRADGRIVGSCGIMNVTRAKDEGVELGLLIGDKGEWGRGFAKEILELLADHARAALGATRVYVNVDANHERAQRAYRKAGFDIVKTVPAPDRPHGGGFSHVMDQKNPSAVR